MEIFRKYCRKRLENHFHCFFQFHSMKIFSVVWKYSGNKTSILWRWSSFSSGYRKEFISLQTKHKGETIKTKAVSLSSSNGHFLPLFIFGKVVKENLFSRKGHVGAVYCWIHASVLCDTRGRRPRGNKVLCYIEAGSSFFASQPPQ